MQNTFGKKNLWLSFIFLIGLIPGNTQTTMTPDGQFHTLYYNPNDKVQELKIPDDITGGRIYLEGIGADGGIKKNYREGPNLRAEGGEGALIGAWFEIGHGSQQIPPGATILFIIGEKGQDEWAVTPSQAGGGGGTGILFQPNPSSGYNLLIVAGGGGGGAADCCLVQIHGKPGEIVQCVIDNGLPYNPYGSETYCYDDRTVYQDQYHCHRAGSVWDDNSDASYFAGQDYDATPCECTGQAGWPGSDRGREYNNPVKPTGGGMYGNCEGRPSGGFGFGSGAPGKKNLSTESSGGGGYTVSSTSGGGSFITDHFSMDQNEELYLQRGTTRNPEHGNVRYKIIPAPKAVCSDLEVSLPATGTQAFAYFVMAYGSTTTIPGENLLVAEVQSQQLLTTLDCADIGTQVINMEIIGTISGYGTPCTANLTVKDEISPVISCKDISISTAANGHASFSTASLLDAYTDNCSTSPASLTADKNSFTYDCNFDGQTLTESVKVTATDDSGNSKDCNATVTIAVTSMDNLPPIASCKDIAVQLGSQGQLTITPDAIDQGSTDPCGGNIVSYQFGKSHMELQVETEGFNADLSWTITSLDGNNIFAERPSYPHDAPSPGLSASETSFLEEITLAPGCYLFNWKDSFGDGFWCYGETNFYRLTDNDGNVLAYGECSEIGSGQSTQFCIEPDSFVDELVLDCDDIGYYSASLVLTDPSGNTSSCQSVITVEGGPQAVCKPVTVQLDSEGSASLLATSLNAGSSSNCGYITSYQFGKSNMKLQVETEGFNADLSWTITSLDGNTIFAERLSYPHDAPSPGLSASETSFLEDIPLAPGCYLFNWKDSYGDGFWCYGETKFYQLTNSDGDVLAYGECDDIGYGQSTEFCVEPDVLLNELTFDCEDIGDRLATLFVTDVTGRSSSCQTTIEVKAPQIQDVQCSPDIVLIQLDEDGLANLSVGQVLHGDNLSCYENQYSLSKTEFDCQDVGFGQVTLTAQHPDGNTSTCETTIRVQDNILPTPLCQDIMASLGPDGQVTIDASLADNGSTDHCGIFDLYFDDYRLTRTFDCEDVGVEELYTIMVEDYSGNLAYCAITLTIKDETPPIANCKDITIQLDENGIALIPEDAINDQSSDFCGPLSFDVEISSFSCENLGDNPLTLMVHDTHGNSSSCNAVVTIEDKVAPTVVCQNVTVELDENGVGSITAEAVNKGSADACGIASQSLSKESFGCTEVGTQIVSLTVTDASGNSSSCDATITIEDKITPTAICQNVSIQLDENGLGSVVAEAINNGSADACGVASLSLSQESFDCSEVGTQTVSLIVTDVNGNSSSCEATISVLDESAPILTCSQDLLVNTDPGECGAYFNLPKAAPTDNCGIKNLKSRYRIIDVNGSPHGNWSGWANDHSGFFELGFYEIQWRANDDSSNKGFCNHLLEVRDEEAPEMACKNLSIDFNGESSIDIPLSSIYDAGASFDACGSVSVLSQEISQIGCEAVGEIIDVQILGVDLNGNTNSCFAQVTVNGMPCGFEAIDIDCPDGAIADYDPTEESFSLSSSDCEGYPDGEISFVGTQLCGDGEIVARVTDINGAGRAGVVMMENQAPGARLVGLVKDNSPRVRTEYRSSANGSLSYKRKNRNGVEWLKIVRDGNKFKTYTSTNGSYWRLTHSISYSNFEDCIYVGLYVYSISGNGLATATFDQLSIEGTNSSYSPPQLGSSASLHSPQQEQPASYKLAVAPNPFSTQARISFELTETAEVNLTVFSLQGQAVKHFIKAVFDAGQHQRTWDGTGDNGAMLPAGMYLVQLRSGDQVTVKMVSLLSQ